MTYREATRRLCSMGCEEILSRGPGSHRKWFNRSNGKATVIPDHGGKDLKLGTLRAVVRQLGLDWTEFQQKN